MDRVIEDGEPANNPDGSPKYYMTEDENGNLVPRRKHDGRPFVKVNLASLGDGSHCESRYEHLVGGGDRGGHMEWLSRQCLHQKESCEKCPEGQFQDKFEQSACKTCPTGYASGICHECTATQRDRLQNIHRIEFERCYKCPVGTHGIHKNLTSVSWHPEVGIYTSMLRNPNFIEQNLGGFCMACAPGKYQDKVARNLCLQCPSGFFSERSNEVRCTKCLAGRVQSQPGSTFCSDCDSGKVANATSQLCDSW